MREWCCILVVLMASIASAGESPSAKVMQQCWPEHASHVDAGACFMRAYAATKQALDIAYGHALTRARAFDRQWQQVDSVNDYAVMEASLEQSQQAFDVYMKAECARRVVIYTGGNMRGDAFGICQRDLMLERIHMLESDEQPGL
jgi:uncharacterized protein YecT (DUF1311 family)